MAQRGLNKACLIGHLGQDPEVRYMDDGSPVATLSLTTSDTWKDRETGEARERTEWHRIVIFGKLAEVVGRHLKKGSQIYVEGHLRTRRWKDNIGAERQTTEIVVDINGMMQMLGKAPAPVEVPPAGHIDVPVQPDMLADIPETPEEAV